MQSVLNVLQSKKPFLSDDARAVIYADSEEQAKTEWKERRCKMLGDMGVYVAASNVDEARQMFDWS